MLSPSRLERQRRTAVNPASLPLIVRRNGGGVTLYSLQPQHGMQIRLMDHRVVLGVALQTVPLAEFKVDHQCTALVHDARPWRYRGAVGPASDDRRPLRSILLSLWQLDEPRRAALG